jgi:hypothetical protein
VPADLAIAAGCSGDHLRGQRPGGVWAGSPDPGPLAPVLCPHSCFAPGQHLSNGVVVFNKATGQRTTCRLGILSVSNTLTIVAVGPGSG